MLRLRFSSGVVISFVAIGLLVSGLFSPIMADATTIKYGDTVQGTVANDSDPTSYTFAAKEGDTIAVSVEGVDKSLSIWLYLNDATGNQVATDSNGTNTATVENYYIFKDDTYQIDIRGVANQAFNLTLTRDSSAADRKVIFEDKFADNSSDWETGGNSNISADIQKGKYVVDADCGTQPDAWFGAMDLNSADAAPVFENDFVADVEVKFTKAKGEVRLGWVFGVVPPGYQNVSIVFYDTAGGWVYRQLIPGTHDFNDTQDETLRVKIVDGKTHHLGLSVTTSTVRVAVDGIQFVTFPATDPLPGTIGLAAGCGYDDSVDTVHAEFDNLSVTAIADKKTS